MNNLLEKLHLGILLFFVTVFLSSCHPDLRIKGFENFLLHRADSLAYAKCNDKEFQVWINSYKNNPEGFDLWMEKVKHDMKICKSNLYEDCSVIKDLDRKYGRELSYVEVLDLVMSRQDISANPDKIIILQREINALNDFTENIVLWEEAKKWIKSNSNKD